MKLIQSQNKVICFGAANVDIKHKSLQKPVLETSNIVKTSWSPGGVARNVAENLMRLGVSVILISRVGNDEKGKSLLKSMEQSGMDISGITTSQTHATGTYTALLTPEGELVVGMAEMDIYEELTSAIISPIITKVKSASYWILDSNLPEDTLKYISKKALPTTNLWVVNVSIPKIKRLPSVLSRLNGLILNIEELTALFGNKSKSLETIKQSCKELRAKGVGTVVVTRGKQGVVLASDDCTLYFKAMKKHTIDVVGAGDAFAAGMLYGLQSGLEPFQAVPYGLAAAGLNVECDTTALPDLSLKKLVEEMCRIPESSVEIV